MHSLRAARPFRRAFAANQNQNAYATVSPQVARPSGDGVVDLVGDGLLVPAALKLSAVGVGASNDAYSSRVYGWSRVLGPGNTDLWVPQILAELTWTLGALPGLLARIVPSTELFADTVVIATNGEPVVTRATTNGGTLLRMSQAADLVAFAVVPLYGFEMIQFDTKQTTNTPTANILFAPTDYYGG